MKSAKEARRDQQNKEVAWAQPLWAGYASLHFSKGGQDKITYYSPYLLKTTICFYSPNLANGLISLHISKCKKSVLITKWSHIQKKYIQCIQNAYQCILVAFSSSFMLQNVWGDYIPGISSFISDMGCLKTISSSPSVSSIWQFSLLHQCWCTNCCVALAIHNHLQRVRIPKTSLSSLIKPGNS